MEKGQRGKERKLEHCWTEHLGKKKKKTEHLWTVIVILFWLVVKWKFMSLFEFKGDIRKNILLLHMKFDENH